MIRVKLLKNKMNMLERDINEYFEQIGSIPGIKIKLEDIKLIELANSGGDLVSMIVTNQTKVKPTDS